MMKVLNRACVNDIRDISDDLLVKTTAIKKTQPIVKSSFPIYEHHGCTWGSTFLRDIFPSSVKAWLE